MSLNKVVEKDVKKDLDLLLKWLYEAEASSAESNWRKEAMEDYKFYAGKQDYDEVLSALEEQNRPDSTYNKVKTKIDMLVGMAAQSKHECVTLPVGAEDAPLAELMSQVIKFYRRQLKISRKELEVFEHTVKCGRSLLHYSVGGNNPFSPEIKVKRVSGFDYFVDPRSKEYDLSDARYVFIESWLTAEEAEALFGKKAAEGGFDVGGSSGSSVERWLNDTREFRQGTSVFKPLFYDEINDTYRVVEAWYRKWVDVVWFIDPQVGTPQQLTPEEFEKYKEMVKEPLVGLKTKKQQVYYLIFSGDVLLEGGESPYTGLEETVKSGFPFVQCGAFKDEDENRWFGVVQVAKDPQRVLNTTRRQFVHLLQTLPKGMLKHEAGAVLNIEEYETESSKPNFHLEMMEGKMDRAEFVHQPPIFPVYQTLDQMFDVDIKDTMGIHDTLMGVQTTSREPGVSVRARQETNLAVLYPLFANYEEFRLESSRLLMYFIQRFVRDDVLIRIEGEKGAQMLQINSQMNPQVEGWNDISAGRFDLVVEEVAETATTRTYIAQILAEYAHNNPGAIPPDLILEYSNVPFSVKQQVKAFHEQQMMAQQKQQEAENAFKQRELEIKMLEAEAKMVAARRSANESKQEGKQKSQTQGQKKKGKA